MKFRILAICFGIVISAFTVGCDATQVGNPDGGTGLNDIGWAGQTKEGWEGGGPLGAFNSQQYR